MSAEQLLYKRYFGLIKTVTDIDKLVSVLCSEGLITSDEHDAVIQKSGKPLHQHRVEICKVLTSKGISRLNKFSKVIKGVRDGTFTTSARGQENNNCFPPQEDVVSSKVSLVEPTAQKETTTNHNDTLDDEGSTSRFKRNEGKASRIPRHLQGINYSTDTCSCGSNSCTGLRGECLLSVPSKQQIKDVPDPPSCDDDDHSLSQIGDMDGGSTESRSKLSMEAFILLFYMTITQLLQSICGRNPANKPGTINHENDPSSPSLSEDKVKRKLSWLKTDMDPDTIKEFFPAEAIKGVTPSASRPVDIRVSVILEAFQQFLCKFTELSKKVHSLSQQTKRIDDIVTQTSTGCIHNADGGPLEAGLITKGPTGAALVNCNGDEGLIVEQLKTDLSRLQKQLKSLEPLQGAYANSEERCKQLVEVTQQWAIECEEKDSLIAVLGTQNKQLQSDIDQLQKRVHKYKQHWMTTRNSNRQQGNQRVSDSQFEELRLELALRRELHDQVIAERDEAVEKMEEIQVENNTLKSELESLRDLIEELKDRVGNFKVQAQAKEPSVREMSMLSSENRKMKEEIQQLRKENSDIKDELLAYKTYVSDLTQGSVGAGDLTPRDSQPEPQQQQRPPVPLPRRTQPPRTQAMVTGYKIPKRLQPSHPQQLHTPTNISHHQQTPPPIANSILDNTPKLACFDDDTPSATADQPDSDKESVSTLSEDDRDLETSSLRGFRYRPGSAPYSHGNTHSDVWKKDSQSAPISPHTTTSLSHTHPPTITTISQFGSHEVKVPSTYQQHTRSTDSYSETGDYTQHIRYPNNSGILVEPLRDDEVSLQNGSHGNEFRPPGYYDRNVLEPEKHFMDSANPPPPNQPTAMLSTSSPLLSTSITERQCPVCKHVFLALGESEFHSHVAGCFK